MKIGDLVMVVTRCPDCGNVPARILEIVDDRFFVELIGDLPHKAQERNIWLSHKHIRGYKVTMNEDSKGIMLDEECFKCLVRGGVVHFGKIRIALSDIGYVSMLDAIIEAVNSKDLDKDHHIND